MRVVEMALLEKEGKERVPHRRLFALCLTTSAYRNKDRTGLLLLYILVLALFLL